MEEKRNLETFYPNVSLKPPQTQVKFAFSDRSDSAISTATHTHYTLTWLNQRT